MPNQYLRKVSLIVYGNPPIPAGTGLAVPAAPASPSPVTVTVNKASPPADQNGIELGTLRVQFSTTAIDVNGDAVPPTANIRVINLSDATAEKIQKEFTNVTLQAGYESGNFGVIFQGTIIRVRKGRLSNIETFVDIMASNLDWVFNYGVVNTTVAAGANAEAQLNAIAASVNNSPAAQSLAAAQTQGMQFGYIPNSVGTGGVLPRGKVLFGMANQKLSAVTASKGVVWSIGPDGKINIRDFTGYLPGEAVLITAQTGLIGVPEATTNGIEVRTLLNPLIKSGGRVQLDNASLVTTMNRAAVGFPAYSDIQFFANTSQDGFYRVMVVEHEGDSRGTGADWLTKVTALSMDSSGQNPVGAYQ